MPQHFLDLWDFTAMASGYANEKTSLCIGVWACWSRPDINLTYTLIRMKTFEELNDDLDIVQNALCDKFCD